MKNNSRKRFLYLDETLDAARLGNRRKAMKNGIIMAVGKLAKELRLDCREVLFCFFSPHLGPQDHDAPRPYGFNFVIPKPGQRFDQGSVKATFWIERFDKVIAHATCKVFYATDGWAQIADDDFMPPDWCAEELAAHLRDGRQMPYCIGAPVNYVSEQIFPLLKRAA